MSLNVRFALSKPAFIASSKPKGDAAIISDTLATRSIENLLTINTN
jgi:hypothetical protein